MKFDNSGSNHRQRLKDCLGPQKLAIVIHTEGWIFSRKGIVASGLQGRMTG
jgi:hypothetical protein